MAKPFVSVIVPVYNSARFLVGCVDSILHQTYSDLELLLIDDGSTDGSGLLCDGYMSQDARVRVFHKENGGVSSARNYGLARARGDFIAWVDSDDWLAANCLEKCMQYFDTCQADAVLFDFKMVSKDNEQYVCAPDLPEDQIGRISEFIITRWNTLWTSIVKRSIYTDHQLYFPEGISFAEDFLVASKCIFYSNAIVTIHEPLYFYNQTNDSSILSTMKDKKMWSDARYVYSDLESFLRAQGVNYTIKELKWRQLNADSEYLCVNPRTFGSLYNWDDVSYILSCPYFGPKNKILSILAVFRLFWLVRIIGLLKK